MLFLTFRITGVTTLVKYQYICIGVFFEPCGKLHRCGKIFTFGCGSIIIAFMNKFFFADVLSLPDSKNSAEYLKIQQEGAFFFLSLNPLA
jgi:hypothetical protein